jgi:hypothetical protein
MDMKQEVLQALEAWAERQAEDVIFPSGQEVVIIDIGEGLLRGRRVVKGNILVGLSDGRTFTVSVKEVRIKSKREIPENEYLEEYEQSGCSFESVDDLEDFLKDLKNDLELFEGEGDFDKENRREIEEAIKYVQSIIKEEV